MTTTTPVLYTPLVFNNAGKDLNSKHFQTPSHPSVGIGISCCSVDLSVLTSYPLTKYDVASLQVAPSDSSTTLMLLDPRNAPPTFKIRCECRRRIETVRVLDHRLCYDVVLLSRHGFGRV